ncbi:MAG: transposase [Streptococcaceae bacterium]|nr:transposase [Streptococcaceae bacterium]
MLKLTCQWRALPHDYPKWKSVYTYFKQWSTPQKIKQLCWKDF